MPLKTIPLKVCVPLTLEDIIFLESDLSLITVLIKALSSNLPQTQTDRIARIRKLLIDIKDDKKNKFFKYDFPEEL
jgi:hypothetical protein